MDQMTFLSKQDGPRILLLGGRAWQVNHIDWSRKKAYVEPTEAKGRTRWSGAGQGVGFALSQSIKRLLVSNQTRDCWSRRASECIIEIRHEYPWLRGKSTVAIQAGSGVVQWWTFGGVQANAALANELTKDCGRKVDSDSFTLEFHSEIEIQAVEEFICNLQLRSAAEMVPDVDGDAIDGLKFSECLPRAHAIEMLQRRLQDVNATQHILQEQVRFIVQ